MSCLFTLRHVGYSGPRVQPRHAHEALQLSMVLRGGVEETVGNTTHEGAALHIAAKDAGLEHANRWPSGGTQIVRLEAYGESLAHLAACDSAPAWRWRFDPVAIRAFLRLASLPDGSAVSAGGADGSDLIAALVARPMARDNTIPPMWLVDVVRTLEANWTPELDTAVLAHQAHVHPVYLARCVRRWYGVSVGDLLRRQRLRQTVAQLAASRDRLAIVAYRCGFADEAHCSRSVRAALGLAPSALRAMIAA